MPNLLRSALLGALALAPTAGLAQMVIQEPALIVGEPAIVVQPPMVGAAGIMADDARVIAMMNGVAVVESVDKRWWDGHYEVEGMDAMGEDLEVTIDGETGAVMEIDD